MQCPSGAGRVAATILISSRVAGEVACLPACLPACLLAGVGGSEGRWSHSISRRPQCRVADPLLAPRFAAFDLLLRTLKYLRAGLPFSLSVYQAASGNAVGRPRMGVDGSM